VLSVGLVAVGALVLNSRAADQPALGSRIRTGAVLINGQESSTPRPADSPNDPFASPRVDFSFEAAPQQLQKQYVDLHSQIAARLTTDQLRPRIAAAEKELQQTEYELELERIKSDLEQLKARFPNTDATERAEQAIEALERTPTRPAIKSEVPTYRDPNS
jgi:hypothetical protein